MRGQRLPRACRATIFSTGRYSIACLLDAGERQPTAAGSAGCTYRGTDDDVQTFGVGATFISSDEVPEEVVYILVKAVFDNIDDFKQLHPAFANLDEEAMISDGLSAPLHDGAKKYYAERGWM